jgi:pimeloyl-ACP methyl ester carboxylesterase
MIEIPLTSGSRALDAHLVSPEGDTTGAGLLFVHGLGSDQSGYLERARVAADELRCTCLTFDLSGHGASEGDWSKLFVKDHFNDVVAAYDVLTSRSDIDPERIGVCAASYGAYLTGRLITERPVARLLLRAPALYDDRVVETRLDRLQPSDPTVPAGRFFGDLAAFVGEVLVVEGELDETIPHRIIERYLEALTHGQHRVIAGATHQLTSEVWRNEFRRIILDWFRPL